MSLLKKLKGTGVAVVTPFKKDLSIDFDAIKNIVDYLVNNGINYIVVQGTTGESSTMSNDEKIISRKAFVEANYGRIPLVLGLGSNDTMSLLNQLKDADCNGYSAILSVTPYYNKPSMKGLYNHFSLLAQYAAEHFPLAIFLACLALKDFLLALDLASVFLPAVLTPCCPKRIVLGLPLHIVTTTCDLVL